MQFSDFSIDALRASPKIAALPGDYKAEYHAFSLHENSHKTPVILLGGAFQNFTSFRDEVELLHSTHPVIMIDLPSQGNNNQLAPELDLPDYAHLLNEFCIQQELPRVILIGISYGSAMSTLFASAYPEKAESLLLSGITCFRRESLLTLLDDGLGLLSEGNMKAFAASAVCNLINHCQLHNTGVSPIYRRMLYRQIARMSHNEQQRYIQNTERLLNFEGFTGFPECPTLIATGEYDNFTLPSENAAVARQCKQAVFAIIHNADHLAQYERKEASSTLFHQFLQNASIDNIPGVTVYSPEAYDPADQRLQTRHRPLEQPFTLHDRQTGKQHSVLINNINFAGCDLEQIQVDLALTETSDQLYLELPETGHCYLVRIMGRDRKNLRCLIIQHDLKAADALLNCLNNHALIFCEEEAGNNKPDEQLA